MNRNDINYNIVQHVIYDPSYPINATNRKAILSEDTPVIYRHKHGSRTIMSCLRYLVGARIKHEYYINIFLEGKSLTFSKDGTKLEKPVFKYILGPIGSKKYAQEVSEKLNNKIHTNENIDIKIKLGAVWSYR